MYVSSESNPLPGSCHKNIFHSNNIFYKTHEITPTHEYEWEYFESYVSCHTKAISQNVDSVYI